MSPLKIRCLTCGAIVIHDKRNVAGCNCDPDAPTWVYIQPDGRPRALGQGKWEEYDVA